jgi:hypothetical protein
LPKITIYAIVLTNQTGGEGMKGKTTVKPGQPVLASEQYKTPGREETTLVKGKPAPPTPKKGQEHTLVDKTKHKK